jgi:hypothetical protein
MLIILLLAEEGGIKLPSFFGGEIWTEKAPC